jgi:tight adherence protein C
MLVTAVILTALATAMIVRAFVLPRLSVGSNVRRISDYGYAGTRALPQDTAALGHRRVAALLRRLSPAGYEERTRERFLRAGDFRATPEKIILFRYGLPVAVGALALVIALGGASLLVDVCMALATVLSLRVPEILLSHRIARRAAEIEHEIPDFIELLAITVEAGLGFEAAAQSTIGRMTGPLREEFGLMLQEVRMGVARDEAIKRVTERVDSRNLKTFARTLIQGQTLGVPLGTILKNLALDMRIRRRQAAEEKAQKAPVKMVLISFALIFPALLVVLLGPAAFRIADYFVK